LLTNPAQRSAIAGSVGIRRDVGAIRSCDPSRECFSFPNLDNAVGFVSIDVLTSFDVIGHRYLSKLIVHSGIGGKSVALGAVAEEPPDATLVGGIAVARPFLSASRLD
jgi:hypothetical protein